MKSIAVDAVVVSSERHRKEFKQDELRELEESIQRIGLLHPIVVRIEGDNFVLVAGERRLRALKNIYAMEGSVRFDNETLRANSIPYITLGELDPIAREEAELDENIKRTNLTWQERAAATGRLMKLRSAQAERSGDLPPTVAKLSQEVRGSSEGFHHDTTRKELLLADHLHDPEIAAAKSSDDAWKVLKKREEKAKNEELATRIGLTFTADLHKLHNADACEWMKESSAERFDVILTDPPYGMGADSFGDSGSTTATEHTYKDTREYFEKLMEVFCPQSFRLAKPQAHAYVFCDIDNFFDLRMWMTEAGWWVFRTPLIWHTSQGFRMPWPEHGPQRKYETILYAVKGKRPALYKAPDVLSIAKEFDQPHAAQKPVELFSELLRRSAHAGDAVFDPFCGSGTIFPAAHSLKCIATGIELNPASYGVSVKRLEGLKNQLELKV